MTDFASRSPAASPRWALTRAALACALVGTLACASGPRDERTAASAAKYPRRAAGCDVALYHTPVPGVPAWDDLGVAEATCHISGAAADCLRALKAEACRMGGDLLYNVPRQPLRPRDQVLLYRGQVAHRRVASVKKEEDPDLPPPASAEEAAGPVVPLPSAAAPVPTAVPPAPSSPSHPSRPLPPSPPPPGPSEGP